MTELKRKAAHTSFWISLAYVGLGTIMFIMRISPDNSIMQILVPLVMILTIPVIFIGFGIFYGGGQESIPLVLLVQLFIFLITWYVVYSIFLRRYKKELLI